MLQLLYLNNHNSELFISQLLVSQSQGNSYNFFRLSALSTQSNIEKFRRERGKFYYYVGEGKAVAFDTLKLHLSCAAALDMNIYVDIYIYIFPFYK